MAKRKAQKSIRDIVRDTFTPSRVGLLSWAFAAIVMGTVGLASYQFSYPHSAFPPAGPVPTGLPLPPSGDIETTASITRRPAIELMQLPANRLPAPESGFNQGQIEVLQREIVGLRRRLSALSEQNITYSRRIAALEKQAAITKLSGSGKTMANDDEPAEPGPGVVITKAAPTPLPAVKEVKAPETSEPPATPPQTTEQAGTSEGIGDQAKTPPRLISLYRTAPDVAENINPHDPVRIVEKPGSAPPPVMLPPPSEAPVSTGSIPATGEAALPPAFDATPTQTALRPKVLSPSDPAGRLRGGGDRQLKRSDFGAIIGHYRTSAGAAKAWADFKNQNVERMRDLHPLLMQRQTADGGIALMVGPFANAADAAVACLYLLDVTELCRPAIYAGDPLVTAAEFRDSAF